MEPVIVEPDVSSDITITLYNNSNKDTTYRTITFNPEDESTYTKTNSWTNPFTGETTSWKSDKTLGSSTSRTGYTFTEWNTKRDGKGESYKSNATIKTFTQDISLYAQWEKKKYKVEFRDGDNVVSSRTGYDYEDSVEFPEPPTKDGYKFYGWSSNSSSLGNITSATVGIDFKAQTKTYYASWVKNNDIGITSVEVSVPETAQESSVVSSLDVKTFTTSMNVKINTNDKIRNFNNISYNVTTSDGQSGTGDNLYFGYKFTTKISAIGNSFYNQRPITITIKGYNNENKLIDTKEISVVLGITNKTRILWMDYFVNLNKYNNFSETFTINN